MWKCWDMGIGTGTTGLPRSAWQPNPFLSSYRILHLLSSFSPVRQQYISTIEIPVLHPAEKLQPIGDNQQKASP
ncbi:hypothetical protein LY78DRAFT_660246 [Colletotrichum sublineola]|nr:hypothetical protein LY78DRAFT_660246 [Colletotrichum sublineola]